MGVAEKILFTEPLPGPYFDLDWGCDCGASQDERHTQMCAVTPIYASLVPHAMNMIIGSFHAAKAMMTQTVIKCAECGRERLGRDLDVIYQAPLNPHAASVREYMCPHNIVKAVCPGHNRKGTRKISIL